MENNIVSTGAYKIYKINRSKLEERLDVDYYHPSHYKLLEKLKKSKYKIQPLSKIVDRIFDGPFGSSVKSDDYVPTGIPFIRVADVTHGEGTISNRNLIYISEEKHREIIRSKVLPGDIVIAKTGATMGAASIVPSNIPEANIRGDLAGLAIANNPDLSQYICNYINTDIGYSLFWRLNSGATRGRVVLGNLKKFPVIVPDQTTIKKINLLYKKGREVKAQKLKEAQSILDGIDNYILSELGIKIPFIENTLNNRIFISSSAEVTGNRYDPKLYSSETKAIKEAITKSKYQTYPLDKFITHSSAGDWGKEDTGHSIDSHIKCLVIRATEFSNLFNLKLDNSRVKHRFIKLDKLNKIDLKSGDLLIEKSGGSIDQPVGRVAILRDDLVANNTLCYSNFIYKIRVDTQELNPEYLFAFLKAMHSIKLTEAMQSQTNGIRNLIMKTYLKQLIPKPKIETQNNIAIHVMSLRNLAASKIEEARQNVANTKYQIEKLILQP